MRLRKSVSNMDAKATVDVRGWDKRQHAPVEYVEMSIAAERLDAHERNNRPDPEWRVDADRPPDRKLPRWAVPRQADYIPEMTKKISTPMAPKGSVKTCSIGVPLISAPVDSACASVRRTAPRALVTLCYPWKCVVLRTYTPPVAPTINAMADDCTRPRRYPGTCHNIRPAARVGGHCRYRRANPMSRRQADFFCGAWNRI